MPVCQVCGVLRPDRDFYASNRAMCIPCVRLRVKRRSLTNPAVQEYDRARAKRPSRVIATIETTRKWRAAHPEAYRAQNAVNNAIRDGNLRREPCTICGTENNVHAHHKDYSKPLEVTWLCAKCHQRIHASFPELGGNFEGARP
jgi:hypothetical protein